MGYVSYLEDIIDFQNKLEQLTAELENQEKIYETNKALALDRMISQAKNLIKKLSKMIDWAADPEVQLAYEASTYQAKWQAEVHHREQLERELSYLREELSKATKKVKDLENQIERLKREKQQLLEAKQDEIQELQNKIIQLEFRLEVNQQEGVEYKDEQRISTYSSREKRQKRQQLREGAEGIKIRDLLKQKRATHGH